MPDEHSIVASRRVRGCLHVDPSGNPFNLRGEGQYGPPNSEKWLPMNDSVFHRGRSALVGEKFRIPIVSSFSVQ